MAKKNKKIQDQLEQGLKNAEQVVDVQLEGKLAPREPIKAKSWGGWKTPEQTPAAVAPSAPAAGAQPAAQNLAQFEDEITKVINESQYFKRKYDELRYLIESGEPQNVVADATTALAETISRSTGGQLPQEEVASFLENKIAAKKAPAPVMAEGGVQVPPSGETGLSVAPTPISSEILPGVQTPEKQQRRRPSIHRS